MIADAAKQAIAVTGGAAIAANLVNNPIMTLIFQIVVLITCTTVMGRILYQCWRSNRKAKKCKEARRGTGKPDIS